MEENKEEEELINFGRRRNCKNKEEENSCL